jgi:O-antigen/teichoic acid export membrane protein
MKREFTINIILLLLINFLIKPAYIFGIDARVQNLVGTEAYGTYFAYFNFVFLFQFLNDPGLQNWNAQYVPKNRENINFHFSNLISAKLWIGIIFFSFIYSISFITGYHKTEILLLITLNLIFSSIFMLCRNTIAGLGRYKVDSVLSALDKLLMFFIIGYMVWLSPFKYDFKIELFLYGQLVSFIVAIIIALIILLKGVKFSFHVVSLAYIKKMLLKSSPYILTALFMTIYTKMDGVMLDKMLNDNNFQAGVYATAYRFFDAANMSTFLFAGLVLPMFAANIFDKEILTELLHTAARMVLVVSVVIATVLYIFSYELIDVLLDNYSNESITVLKILSITYLIMSVSYILGALMIAKNDLRKLNLLFATGILVNFILNTIFISMSKAIGAAFATLITQTFILIGQYYIVLQATNIKFETNTMIRLLIFVFMSFICGILIYTILDISIILKLFILICLILLISFFLKMVTKGDFKRIINKSDSN